MDAVAKHEEMMALSAQELDIWLQEAEDAGLEECAWILMPSSIGKKMPLLDSTSEAVVVPVRWTMGDMSWYVVEYDGKDTVAAYYTDPNGKIMGKSVFNITALSDMILVSNSRNWRVYRDINWNPTTQLNSLLSSNEFLGTDDELIF